MTNQLPLEPQPEEFALTVDQRQQMMRDLLALPLEKLAETAVAAMDALDAATAEGVTGDDLAMLQAFADAAQEALLRKPDNYVWLLRHLENQALAIKAEMQRLTSRKKIFENKAERLEKRLFLFVQAQEGQKIETAAHTINLAKKPARVAITNLEALPEMFKTLVPEQSVVTTVPAHTEVDEKAVLALLKAKRAVEGAELVQEYRLQIR